MERRGGQRGEATLLALGERLRSACFVVASGEPGVPVSEDVGCTPERAELHVENEFSTEEPETDHARGYQSIRGS